MEISDCNVNNITTFTLDKIPTEYTGKYKSKEEAKEYLQENIVKMRELQGKLYANNQYALLLVFQAMDTAGKDGAIKHVMSGLNPQGTQVHSFKVPSAEELDHDYLWRANKHLPERGRIGIFNRSYYEEVLVVKVHNLLKNQQIPKEFLNNKIWDKRYRQINDYEKYLHENGMVILKFFLHISKEEQKRRLLSRIDDQRKNWKFSEGDIRERGYWEQYQKCYQEAIAHTSTSIAPWYVIPSDKKWYARIIISEIIIDTLEKLKLEYPKLNKEQLAALEKCRQQLMNEK